MTGMDEPLRPKKGRITILQPGIGVRHVRYIAICQHCGQGKLFEDPSRFDVETNDFIWALNQYLISRKE